MVLLLLLLSFTLFCIRRSFFGGQVLTITGEGFGTDPATVNVGVGGSVCTTVSVDDTSILCITPPATRTYQVNNNA